MVDLIRTIKRLLIIDDSIKPKKHTKPNSFINWHYDHFSGKSVKVLNFVSSYYYSAKYAMGFTVDEEFVKKDVPDINTKVKSSFKSKKTKNEMMRHIGSPSKP